MTCEKQFLPANNTFLYCSEACRLHDQAPPRSNSYAGYASNSPPESPYSRHFSSYPSAPSHEDGPDIIPRFSPTQTRPRSYYNTDPYPTYQIPLSSSPVPQHSSAASSTALASLRELATALPRTSNGSRSHDRSDELESPPKSSASSISRTGSGVWNYIPFTAGSKTSTPTPSATPGNSYTQSSAQPYNVSQSYCGRSREDLYGYGTNHNVNGVVGYGYTTTGMDRPLPPRRPGGNRPRSIDLVTPFSRGH